MGAEYSHERWLQVNWPDFIAAGGATRIASGDIDGDGKDEIIIGLGPVPGAPSLPAGTFEILDDDFTHLAWGEIGWSDYNQVNGESWPCTGDLDGDGKDEIIIGLGQKGEGRIEIFGYGASGLVHKAWAQVKWQDYNEVWGETRVAAGDIDGDGKDEIVIGLGPAPSHSSMPAGVFEILDDDLTHLTWGEIGWSDYNQANGESRPSTGDLDGDGKDEIIMGLGPGGQGRFETFRLSLDSIITPLDWGEIKWQDYAALYGETHPTTADVDFDGKDEIILGLGVGGDGWIDILDDASRGYALLKSVQTGFVETGEVSGETWPSITSLKLFAPEIDGNLPDSDGDGFSDYYEALVGSDPLNAASKPVLKEVLETDTFPVQTSATVALTWDPNTESDLAGYRLHYGTETGNYTVHVDVGNVTTYSITGLVPGNTYYFAATAYNISNEESDYSSEAVYLCGTLSAITGAASDITSNSATLSAIVNPNGVETTVIFEYGATTDYGHSVNALQSPISGSTDITVTGQISGLTPSETYHFRIVATNAAGTAIGNDMTFLTNREIVAIIIPSVVTGEANGITSDSATLNASVNPNGAETTVIFEYGATTDYGHSVNALQSPISGSTDITVTGQISGLTSSGVYHFRVVATNAAGTTTGSDHVFTNVDKQGKMILIGPEGDISDNLPTYSWYAVPGATEYTLTAKDSFGARLLGTYSAEESGCASGQGICSVTSTTVFADGSCKWRAQALFEDHVKGKWSNEMVFSIH